MSKHLTDLIIKELLEADHKRQIALTITGSGDPFASPVFRKLLRTFDWAQFPNIKIDLLTNGVMFTEKMWGCLHKIHRNVRKVYISIDAASPETYKIVRRGGNWLQLMENLRFLAQLRRENKLQSIQFNFVVQRSNYREMPLFIKAFLGTMCDNIVFTFLCDWGVWQSRTQYEQQCVWKQTHPEFQDFLRVLRDPVFNNPMIEMGNIFEYRKLALSHAVLCHTVKESAEPVPSPIQPSLPLAERYLRTNDPKLFRLSFLCDPVFVANRFRTLRSWRDFHYRTRNVFRLLTQKLLNKIRSGK